MYTNTHLLNQELDWRHNSQFKWMLCSNDKFIERNGTHGSSSTETKYIPAKILTFHVQILPWITISQLCYSNFCADALNLLHRIGTNITIPLTLYHRFLSTIFSTEDWAQFANALSVIISFDATRNEVVLAVIHRYMKHKNDTLCC